MSSLWFSTLKCVSKVGTILLKTLPHVTVSITQRLHPTVSTPSYKAITRTLWKPLLVSNFSLTSHLFFLLAPRQHWDQTQAPLSCSRDKMACVVLGFCDCRWISFLGSPNLFLGPVLSANPAGFVRPVHSIRLYLTGVVLSYSTMNCTPMSIRADGLRMSTGLTQPNLPPQQCGQGGGWNLLYRIQELVVVCQDGSWGKFGWSEGDVLEIMKMDYWMIYNKAGKVHL